MGESREPTGTELIDVVDTIQQRYGWTDREIRDLCLARIYQLAEVIHRKRAMEALDRYKEQAYQGYLRYLMTPLKDNHQHMGFGEWLNDLGLGDEPPERLPETEDEMIEYAKEAIRVSYEVAKADNFGVKENGR